MFVSITKLYRSHKQTVLALLIASAFSVLTAYATPPGSPYTGGQTLDPACAPGDTNCTVTIGGGSSQWDDVTGGINYAGGNVGIGTLTPQAALDVTGELRATNLTITGTGVTVPAPTNLSVSQTCAADCIYFASGYTHNYRVYSYKTVGAGRVYSATYLTLNTDFVDDNSNTAYDLTVSWTAAAGADGYRILKSDDYNGYTFDAGYDTTSTSFVDDACGNVCFDILYTDITPTTSYSNTATINATLALSGPITMQGVTINTDGSNFVIGTNNPLTGTGNFFVGANAGNGVADSTSFSNFIGPNAGYQATNATYSNFFGHQAGQSATNATYSNFFGHQAGQSATDASASNFFGDNAGYQATNAAVSNFFGGSAGYQATDASYSNFFGNGSGYQATNASNSNFFGHQAGQSATNATYSNFFGHQAGQSATDASNSNFFGGNAGASASGAAFSNFFGSQAGQSATNATYSNFFGHQAGQSATDASASNFFGDNAGYQATNAAVSNFFGGSAGYQATNATYSNFFGHQAGQSATDASNSNFFGGNAGASASGAAFSNFFGSQAGQSATNATYSNFIGQFAGKGATSAANSNFIGSQAGQSATNAEYSTFIGYGAGVSAANARKSIIIGYNAGSADSVNNTGDLNDYSILIGNNTSTGGFSNSIALGAYVINSASNQFMIGSSTRPINTTRWNGSAGTQCTITTGTGIACTSDERLKTNITDLPSDTLAKIRNIDTVTFNWKNDTMRDPQIGFIAQNLEQYFPELVATDTDGYKSVYYAQMTPILTKALQELDVQVQDIATLNTEGSFASSLRNWLGDAQNGIQKLFAKEIETQTLCVADETGAKTCLTKAQLDALIQSSNQSQTIVVPESTPAASDGSEVVGETAEQPMVEQSQDTTNEVVPSEQV